MDASTLAWLVAPGLVTGIGGLFLLVIRRPGAAGRDPRVPRHGLRRGRAAGRRWPSSRGAMIYVVVDEMLPESSERGNEREATGGFVLGFIVMMLPDNALG